MEDQNRSENVNAFTGVVGTKTLPALGPGPRPEVESVPELDRALDDLFSSWNLPQKQRALLRCSALLWHDHLEPAHGICQSISTRDGSLLHAIMHRREPDFSNSKYWFHRAGDHPVYPDIAARVLPWLTDNGHNHWAKRLVPNGQWDPIVFVDACSAAHGKPDDDKEVQLLRQVQRLEFESLWRYFLRPRLNRE